MIVITHNGVSTNIDAVESGKGVHFIDDPLSTVLITDLVLLVFTTQEATPNTTRNAVIVRCCLD